VVAIPRRCWPERAGRVHDAGRYRRNQYAVGLERDLEAALAGDQYAVAFRVRNASDAQKNAAVSFAFSQVGKKFNYVGACMQALFRTIGGTMSVNVGPGENRTYFCSELVVRSYANAGVSLAAVGDITPNGIAPMQWTADLEYVGHLKYTP
jgi:uncharacterized protein YycO